MNVSMEPVFGPDPLQCIILSQERYQDILADDATTSHGSNVCQYEIPHVSSMI
jgi:hypothetical protein